MEKSLKDMKDDVTQDMQGEVEQLKGFVREVTESASAKSKTLQAKYDNKLDGIKDVCSQYFSKYEKHLFNQQDIVKTLEKR